jgi:hypothetical protein
VLRGGNRSITLARQLIDQLYFSMIEIGQHGKQAIETEANAD